MPRQVADGRRIAKRTQCLTFTIFTRVKQKVEMRCEHFFLSLPFQTPNVYYEKKNSLNFEFRMKNERLNVQPNQGLNS